MNDLKSEVASFMARLYDRGLTTAGGGNVSAREGNVMYITPSGGDKSCIPPSMIAAVDIESGKNMTPHIRLSIEAEMHRAVYQAYDDVHAVVHSHPLHASMFSALEESIDTHFIAESYYLLGEVVKVPYALMGTKELAENVCRALAGRKAVLLENHGALTTGTALLQAFERMEVLENAARMTYMCAQRLHPLLLDETRLDEIKRNFGG